MATFPEVEFSVREAGSNLSVCVNMTSGPEMKDRNVSLSIFSADGSASGKCYIISVVANSSLEMSAYHCLI